MRLIAMILAGNMLTSAYSRMVRVKKEKPLFHISHSSPLSRGAVGQAYG